MDKLDKPSFADPFTIHNQPHTHNMKNTKFQNWSTVLKGRKGQVFYRLPNGQTICLVEKPRTWSAYLVKPAIGEGDARALQLYTEKRRLGALSWIETQIKLNFPEAVRA